MRELTFQEKEEVGGGFGFIAWAASSIGVVAASYGMAKAFNSSSSSSGSSGGRIVDTGSSCMLVP